MPLLLAISIVSAGVLAYEVLLMRSFAIVQWHHFAYMVISIALLGFGASGSFLALAQGWLKPRFSAAFAGNAALFGLSAVASFALAQRLPFNALEVVWEPRQLGYLLLLYGLFTVPFFCGANCIGLAFVRFGDRIGRIYRYDLVGAGVGSLGIVLALFALTPSNCLRLLAGLGIAAAALALAGERGARRWVVGLMAVAAVIVPAAVPSSWTALRLSEYKGLSQALQVPDTAVIDEISSPLGLLTLVRSPTIPFRHAPGLSLHNTVEPPDQLGLFTDGDSLSVITAFDDDRDSLAYLDFTTSALPYHLRRQPRVLVLGAGGGADVLQAVYHQASRIDAVELDPAVVRLVRDVHGDFAGGIYARPEVRLHVAEARGFVAGAAENWDIIQIPLLDSFASSAAGVHSLSESYVYTVEAFREYLRHLAPGGLLAITRWLKLPPRDALKLFLTALTALESDSVAEPWRRLALIRSWSTTTLLVKDGAFGDEEIAAIRAFAAARAFDLAYLPGIERADANRSNRLDVPHFFDGADALIGPQRAGFVERYKFDIRPARDDRPYFFDFFRWGALPELVALRTQGGAALIEWGYLILFATLVQAAVLSVVLILLPLAWRRRSARPSPSRWRVAGYFFGLGLAFLFIEIAFIQRFILFLSHPLYAVAVVLSGMLIFAGLGSGWAPWLAERLEQRRAPVSGIEVAVLGIAAVALAYLVLLPPLFGWLLPLPDLAKIVVSLVLIAPLAFCMGMPFPLGLARVSARLPDLVPWAWGINGCASVLSAVLATILAIHFGFTAVVAIAVVLYVTAAAAFRAPLAVAADGPG
jgi:SAM-dependent methyltransferase